jgi:hypothetical protein
MDLRHSSCTKRCLVAVRCFPSGGNKKAVEERQRLDDAIREFVSAVATMKDVDEATRALRDRGFDSDLVHRVNSFVPLAFCRVMFSGSGVAFSSEFIRIKKDGTSETLKFMREPAYARAVILYIELIAGGLAEAMKQLAMWSSTLNAINSALLAGSKPENLVMTRAVIPDPGTNADAIANTMQQRQAVPVRLAAVAAAKPWWRFW